MSGGLDVYQTGVVKEDLEGEGRIQGSILFGDGVANDWNLGG